MNRLNHWKHWPKFWQLVREHNVCPESDKERLGECNLGIDVDYNRNYYNGLCVHSDAGFAGMVMRKLTNRHLQLRYLDLSTYTPKTAALPINNEPEQPEQGATP